MFIIIIISSSSGSSNIISIMGTNLLGKIKLHSTHSKLFGNARSNIFPMASHTKKEIEYKGMNALMNHL